MHSEPDRGINITTAELASEGTDTVLDAIAATGASAITTTTDLVIPASGDTGASEPGAVAGVTPLVDRPIWSRRAAPVRRFPAHPPDPELWHDLPWLPPAVAPAGTSVDLAREAIAAARARGLRTHIRLTPYALPGGSDHRPGMPTSDELRQRHRPTRFIGGIQPNDMEVVGCPNHPTVRQLGRVRLTGLLRHYGDADGIVLDAVEYPLFHLDGLFTCFCDHCRDQAGAFGYDWDQITAAVRGLWDSLHTLTPDRLDALTRSGDWGDLVVDPDAMLRGFAAWLDFKADTVTAAIADLRQVMRDAGAATMQLTASELAPPWGRMAGEAAGRPERGPDARRLKLDSPHWLVMVRWWTKSILAWNRGSTITPEAATRAVMSLFALELRDAPATLSPDLFGMPAPDHPHNLTPASYTGRLENAMLRHGEHVPLVPQIHAARPAGELASLLDTLRSFTRHGVWIHRYGYLSDEKLGILRQEWSSP